MELGEKASIQAGAEGEEEARTRSLLGTPKSVVVRAGSDLPLSLDASRAQSHHRGTGQCRKDHHSLPVVSNYWVNREGWASHQTDSHLHQSPEPFPGFVGSRRQEE